MVCWRPAVAIAQTNLENNLSLPLVTAGNEITQITPFPRPGRDSYIAAEVVTLMLSRFAASRR
jgi:hypothetical protein